MLEYYADAVKFFPLLLHLEAESYLQLRGGLCEKKKFGLLEWENVFYVNFERKMCQEHGF